VVSTQVEAKIASLDPVYFCVSKIFLKFFYFFLWFKLIFFGIFRLFWCVDVKNNFVKIKNIILIYFWVKNNLKTTVIITTFPNTYALMFSYRRQTTYLFFLKKRGNWDRHIGLCLVYVPHCFYEAQYIALKFFCIELFYLFCFFFIFWFFKILSFSIKFLFNFII